MKNLLISLSLLTACSCTHSKSIDKEESIDYHELRTQNDRQADKERRESYGKKAQYMDLLYIAGQAGKAIADPQVGEQWVKSSYLSEAAFLAYCYQAGLYHQFLPSIFPLSSAH